MRPLAQHRVTAVFAGVLLAALMILFSVTTAEAKDAPSCTDPTLSGMRATTTLIVKAADRAYPQLTSTTEYEIPPAWPGVAALQEDPEDGNYQAALRCFIAFWPLNQISQVGEYRRQPPVLRVIQQTPPRIVLKDVVIADLTSRTAPPLLGPWEVTPGSDPVQFRVITRERGLARPGAFELMTWTVKVELSGSRLRQSKPMPMSNDGGHQASWALLSKDDIDKFRINVELDFATHLAIASHSGVKHAAAYAVNALANIFLYFAIVFFLRKRKVGSAGARWISAARWISVFGLASEIFRVAAYLWFGKDTAFNGLGIPVAYWRWPGLIGIWTVALIASLIIWRSANRGKSALLALLGLLIAYATAVLGFPRAFNLEQDFSPIERLAGPTAANILPSGGQLMLMTLFTCVGMFVTLAVLYLTHWFTKPDRKGYTLPSWTLLMLSLLASLVLIFQWVLQHMESWNRNHVFPTLKDERSGQQIADVTSAMITYHLDLFGELVRNSVPLTAIGAIIIILSQRERHMGILRPSVEEYRLLGLLFAAAVSSAGSWSVGFMVPIAFLVTFGIAGFIFPWTRKYNPLEPGFLGKVGKEEQEKKLGQRRIQLIGKQLEMDALRDRLRSLDVDLRSGKMTQSTYTREKTEITSSLLGHQYSNGSCDKWQSLQDTRPAEAALAVGPCANWWENGVRAAKIGAWPGSLATLYFSYVYATDGNPGGWYSRLGTLHLLWYIVWQFGFWVVATFMLGCLWTTLPGRQGPLKGLLLGAALAVPAAIDFVLGRGMLHQDSIIGLLPYITLLFLVLCTVGLIFDWLTLRDVDTLGVNKLQPLFTLYRVRGVGSILVTVVPLLVSLIGLYIHAKSGFETPGVYQPPANPPSPSGTEAPSNGIGISPSPSPGGVSPHP